MVSLGAGGIETRQLVESERKAFCVFEHIYFARPDSILEGNRTQVSRRKMGEILFREAPVDADVVIAVPDSGNPAAAGYSKASGIPRDDGLIKNRYVARTFIQPGQELRKHGLRMKFNPLREVVAGKRLVVVDDSIVRGNTTRQIVQMLRDAGAAEIHMRISAPPIRHPCHYGIDMSTTQEMVAHGRTEEEIARELQLRLARLPVARRRLRGDPLHALDALRRLLLGRLPACAHRGRERQVRARADRAHGGHSPRLGRRPGIARTAASVLGVRAHGRAQPQRSTPSWPCSWTAGSTAPGRPSWRRDPQLSRRIALIRAGREQLHAAAASVEAPFELRRRVDALAAARPRRRWRPFAALARRAWPPPLVLVLALARWRAQRGRRARRRGRLAAARS